MIFTLIILVFAGVSFASHVIALVLFTKRPKLLKGFGDVIVVLFGLGLFFDLHWLTLNSSVKNLISSICFEYAILNTSIYFFIWNYSSVLSLQLYGNIENRPETFFKHKKLVYHLFCILISIFETIAIIILGNLGQTSIQTCFITDSSPGEIIYLIPLVLNVPIGILTSIKYFLNNSKKLKYYPACLVLISLIITWGSSTLFIFLGYYISLFNNRFYSECLVSISGFFLLISFVFNKYSLKKLNNYKLEAYERVIYFKRNSSLLLSGAINSSSLHLQRSSSVDMLINYLEDPEKIVKSSQNFLKTIVLVIARFAIGEALSGSECEIPLKKHQYEESIIQELEENLNFSYFSKFEIFNLILIEHYYSDLMLLRFNKNYFDKEILETLLNYQNFYNLEKSKNKILNMEIFTTDKKLCLKMINKSECKKLRKVIESCMKYPEFGNIFEQILAVFEVEMLDRVLIITEGFEWVSESKKIIRISGESELDVKSYNVVGGELIDSYEDIPVIYLENSKIIEEVENGIQFLAKCGALGYYIQIILLNLDQSFFNTKNLKVNSSSIQVKVSNIYTAKPLKNYRLSFFKNKKDLSEAYKVCILKNFKYFFKNFK